jgi:hypothetical protein
MDIIAAHQQGLIEQLEEEVAALAGRPRDHGQRSIVLHHLYDHSRGAHVWALAEARRELHIAKSLAELEQRIGRWGWMISDRKGAKTALAGLAAALGQASQARCAAAYSAYRLSATRALRSEAEQRVPRELLDLLDQCHAARRSGTVGVDAAELVRQSELHAASAVDQEGLAAAWAGVRQTGIGRAATKLLGDAALTRLSQRDARRGWDKVERELRNDPALPTVFRANPAQHFYALHRDLAERRRQQWREACDREPDAFELAA